MRGIQGRASAKASSDVPKLRAQPKSQKRRRLRARPVLLKTAASLRNRVARRPRRSGRSGRREKRAKLRRKLAVSGDTSRKAAARRGAKDEPGMPMVGPP